MYKRFYVLQDEAEGDASSGGTPPSDAGDDTSLDDKIKAAVAAATSGLVNKNKELLGKLAKSHDTLKQFEGIDPEKTKALFAKFDNDEESKLLADGKIDEVLNRKYAKRDQEWQRKFEEAEQRAKQASEKAAKFLDSVLDDRLRAAFNGKVDPRAMRAAMLEAKQLFTLDDEGRAVQLDADGVPILGKDGKSPFSPLEWIDSDTTRQECPYLFPITGSGTGARQTGSPDNKVDLMKLPPAERMAAARKR